MTEYYHQEQLPKKTLNRSKEQMAAIMISYQTKMVSQIISESNKPGSLGQRILKLYLRQENGLLSFVEIVSQLPEFENIHTDLAEIIVAKVGKQLNLLEIQRECPKLGPQQVEDIAQKYHRRHVSKVHVKLAQQKGPQSYTDMAYLQKSAWTLDDQINLLTLVASPEYRWTEKKFAGTPDWARIARSLGRPAYQVKTIYPHLRNAVIRGTAREEVLAATIDLELYYPNPRINWLNLVPIIHQMLCHYKSEFVWPLKSRYAGKPNWELILSALIEHRILRIDIENGDEQQNAELIKAMSRAYIRYLNRRDNDFS